jgi:deoxyadenosine/deoxycytidine kinase
MVVVRETSPSSAATFRAAARKFQGVKPMGTNGGDNMRVSVDGNVGAGKSAVMKALSAAFPDLPCFPEPAERWQSLMGQGPRVPALEASLAALLGFDAPYATPTCLVERSPLSYRHVFAHLLFNEGSIGQAAWDVFKGFYELLGWTPDVIVYVDTPASVCADRVSQRRGATGESEPDITELRKLEYKYEVMLKYTTVPVIRLDGTLHLPQLEGQAVRSVGDILIASSSRERASTSCSLSSTDA